MIEVFGDERDYVLIERLAAIAHENNRIFCSMNGDDSQPHWEDAPSWQQTSAMNGVELLIESGFLKTPKESHENWLKEKERTGWKYGPVKDPEKKEHPCFLPYDQLPPKQRSKDYLFIECVKAAYRIFVSDLTRKKDFDE